MLYSGVYKGLGIPKNFFMIKNNKNTKQTLKIILKTKKIK